MKIPSLVPGLRPVAMALVAVLLLAPVGAAELTFFAFSDCHYGDGTTKGSDTVARINALPGTAYPTALGGVVADPRAVIMAGDLINDGAVAAKYPAQWADYIADYGVNGEGRCLFPVFEGVGNHDLNPNLFVFDQVKQRNIVRKNLQFISTVSENGYHYSWDWEGVHFVNVNLFPGNIWNGEADGYGSVHDPLYARDFLVEDLRKNVGATGRPVVIVQHFRPVDENWWTHAAADKYHKIIQDYNIILLMVGHQGGGINNLWRGINWASSNGDLDVFRITPDNKLSAAVRGAAAWENTLVKNIFFSYAQSGLPAAVSNGDWATTVSSVDAALTGRILYEAASPTRVTLYWGTGDGGVNPAAWQNARDIGVQTSGTLFAEEITGLQPWTNYYYRCQAVNRLGSAWAAASIPFSTRGVLPAGWQTRFIGYEQRAGGGAHGDNGTFTLRGSGRDIGESTQPDNFQYAWRNLEGDGEIQARIATMVVDSREPKVGIMLRESLDDNARCVALLLSPAKGVRLFSRSAVGGIGAFSPANAVTAPPCRVKLVRNGDTFTGYMSPDGGAWTQVGNPVTIPMASGIRMGLAVTAGNRDGSKNHTATFDGLSCIGETGAPPEPARAADHWQMLVRRDGFSPPGRQLAGIVDRQEAAALPVAGTPTVR